MFYGRDIDHLMDQLRRRMDRMLDDAEWVGELGTTTYPRTNLRDTGSAFILEADLPGFSQQDLEVSLLQDVVTISGKREVRPPEGYAVRRQERSPIEFSRSYALPSKVDPEKTVARLQDGVLRLTLEKAPEVQPRQIAVRVN